MFQSAGKEVNRALPCVGRIIRAIASLVVRIFKGVASVRVDHYINFFAGLFQLLFKLLDISGRDSLVLRAEQAENGSVDFLQGVRVGGKVAVIDDGGGQSRLLQGYVERIASPHTPPDGADAVCFDVRL